MLFRFLVSSKILLQFLFNAKIHDSFILYSILELKFGNEAIREFSRYQIKMRRFL